MRKKQPATRNVNVDVRSLKVSMWIETPTGRLEETNMSLHSFIALIDEVRGGANTVPLTVEEPA